MASDVHRLTTPLQKARGVIGREPSAGDRFVFEFDGIARRTIHMVGVRRPLRVTWLIDGEVERRAVLRPWVGLSSARADTVVEEAAEVGR